MLNEINEENFDFVHDCVYEYLFGDTIEDE